MNLIKQFTDYLRASQEEMKKVSWPSRRDTIRYSGLVIGVSVAVAAFFAGLDIGFTKLVDLGLTQRNAAPTQTAPEAAAPTSTSGNPSIDFTNVEPIVTPTTESNGIKVAPVVPSEKK